MRLLDDAGVPCGSIAVSARADGRAYTRPAGVDARRARPAGVVDAAPAVALHGGAVGAAHPRRRARVVVRRDLHGGAGHVGAARGTPRWRTILGVPVEDALGHPVGAVFRPVGEDGQPRHGGADPGRTGKPEAALVRVQGAGGEERWLTCSWSPLSEGGYVVVARDETERKKLQDDKDGWIAQVSHELRTPLTPIKGFLHTLQRRDEQFTGDDRQRIYEVMLREEQRLEDLVNGLLQATSLDQRGLVVVPEVIDWASHDHPAGRSLPAQRPDADDHGEDRPEGAQGGGRPEPGHRDPHQPAVQRARSTPPRARRSR